MTIKASKHATQTQPHQAFPIANFENALFLAREPWLAPKDAFVDVQDVRAFRGQLVKRGGISMFAELGYASSSTSTGPTGIGVYGGLNYYFYDCSVGTTRPIWEVVRLVIDSGVAHANIFAYLANMRWATTIPIVGTVVDGWVWDVVDEDNKVIGVAKLDPTMPAVSGRFRVWVAWIEHTDYAVAPIGTGAFEYTPIDEDEVVGLTRFDNQANEYFLACTPDYAYRYDMTDKYYKRQGFGATGFAGPFTGGNTDYFWFWQVDDYIVMTNNVDPVCKWDPVLAVADSVLEMPTDWVTPGTNEMDTAKLVVAFRGRLIYINTLEGSTRFHTRMRWTDAGTATGWRSASDYSDAPKDLGEARTCEFIGDRLFVGFHHGWMEIVRRPGDDELAFEWQPVISRFGAVSALSTIKDNERLLSRSETTMQSLDPNGQVYVDVQIPDLLLSLSTPYMGLCASTRDELERTFLWTAASRSALRPDQMIAAVYDEKNALSWALYNMPANVFSTFDKQGALTWNQLGPLTWNQYAGQTWNQLGAGSQGTERVIIGYDRGTVYVKEGSVQDYYISGPARIDLVLETQKLAPIPGQRTHFGWLDLFIDAPMALGLRVSFYADENTAPYLVQTLALAPASGSVKIYTRIPVGRTASFHKFKIESLDDTPFAFDAFVPWFRPAGRLRKF